MRAALYTLLLLALVLARAIAQCDQCSPSGVGGDCVNEWRLPCSKAKNYKCEACYLWKQICRCKQDATRCRGSYLRTFFYSEVENPPGAPNPTWLIEPIVAIPGVENIYDGGKAILFSNHLWRQGFNDAVKGALGRPVIAANTLGLVINSARYRSQHQMHIHVSALSAEFASCLAALDLPAASPQLQWQPSTCTLRYFATTARAWLYAARVDTLDNVSGVAWEGMSGDGWADFIGGAAALTPRTDTAVALASAGDGDGYVVVLAAGAGDVGDHNMLDYDPPSAEAEAQAEAEAEAALLKDTAPPVDASV